MSIASGNRVNLESMDTSEPVEEHELTEGGDPACWAGLICQECGAVLAEGHTPACSQYADPAPADPSA